MEFHPEATWGSGYPHSVSRGSHFSDPESSIVQSLKSWSQTGGDAEMNKGLGQQYPRSCRAALMAETDTHGQSHQSL